jgi:hypothetical protein
METVLSGKKSFSWPGKIVVCIIHIVPCKMIIGLILLGLFDNEVFESTLLLLILVGECTFWCLRHALEALWVMFMCWGAYLVGRR